MIRDKNKTYGEVNDDKTVLAPNPLVIDSIVVGANTTVGIKTYTPGKNRLITLSPQGTISSFLLNTPNRLIGTNSAGNLALIERIVLPVTPPAGRKFVTSVYGSVTPSATLQSKTITLEAPFWYEVEVVGAGGGGGAGCVPTPARYDLENGTRGGDGGYYKTTFRVEKPLTVTMQAGNGGGRGNGWIVRKSDKEVTVNGDAYGGQGGRTPIVYSGTGTSGDSRGNKAATETLYGGIGVNGGASGGYSSGGKNNNGPGGAGGGANGPYGGAGGSVNGLEGAQSVGGTGGGAGAGFGTGGSGGSGRVGGNPNDPLDTTKVISYGGGSGGSGVMSGGNFLSKSAGAGGGGGGSRFVAGSLEILCGGGGGGTGGGSTNGTAILAGSGKNNQNSQVGGGAQGGLAGDAVSTNDMPADTTDTTMGTNGQGGWIRIWKCI